MPVRHDGQVNQGVVALWAEKERMSLDDWGQVLLVCGRHTLSWQFSRLFYQVRCFASPDGLASTALA